MFIHRTRHIDSSTGWATRWCLNHTGTSGCMVGCRCQRAFWGMFTGRAIIKKESSECHEHNHVSGCIHSCICCIFIHLFRYSVSERRWTQMLTSALEEGSMPQPRYHHASSLLAHESGSGNHSPSHTFMLVVGGVTQNGVAADTWSLNLSSLIWREHPVSVGFIIHAQSGATAYLRFFSLC